jgi:hypothetical protein
MSAAMFSWLVRRTHMLTALVLAPWVLMYALSTLAMNHKPWFVAAGTPTTFTEERRLSIDASFPPDAEPRALAQQILAFLDLDGAHAVSRRSDGTLVVTRNNLLTPRRITYQPATRTLIVERQEPTRTSLLERWHRRRGYATGYALDTAWAVTVDLFIVGLLLWACSGLWMWWEMKATRAAGALALGTGAALFALFLATI